MATKAQLAELRGYINEPKNEGDYTDEALGERIDASGLRPVAVAVWEAKAARYAHLVNTTEGGSARANGDLYKNAITMANLFRPAEQDGGTGPGVRASRTRRIERV
jgi:hypothetical protein